MDNCPECGTTMTFYINGDWHIRKQDVFSLNLLYIGIKPNPKP